MTESLHSVGGEGGGGAGTPACTTSTSRPATRRRACRGSRRELSAALKSAARDPVPAAVRASIHEAAEAAVQEHSSVVVTRTWKNPPDAWRETASHCAP